MRNWGSVYRGLKTWRPRSGHVNYAVRRATGFWLHAWTPIWHENRGPYISIGLGKVALYRGY